MHENDRFVCGPQVFYAKGVASSSPGLRGTRYPGNAFTMGHPTATRLRPDRAGQRLGMMIDKREAQLHAGTPPALVSVVDLYTGVEMIGSLPW